ncbi:hypothetical protein [Streptomyces europaeiscabiei]|uniref:hypothetical protein n=1 Tax=Streptomyces europaeiscabiei TaxID=146819 RepID=UPI002E165BF2|nr:hypothetical protein OHB30_17750 [Streptomyces europaeiscabiei]
MAKRLRGMVGLVADKLLPQTTAAAGCARECWYTWEQSGGQMYEVRCCVWEDCKVRC